MNYQNKTRLLIFLGVVWFLSPVFFGGLFWKSEVYPRRPELKLPSPSGDIPVETAVYANDKKTIRETVINNIEYYRKYRALGKEYTREQREELCLQHPLAQEDIGYAYMKYATRIDTDGYRVRSPLPTSSQLKVSVDTIVYNKTGLLCIAIVTVEKKYSHIEGLQDYYFYRFCSRGFVGVRKSVKDSLRIYPHPTGDVSANTYSDAAECVLMSYFLGLKSKGPNKWTNRRDVTFFKHNLGEEGFFEESNLFQKYDSTRYNFQMIDDEEMKYKY